MLSPRWMKLARDVRVERGRLALMVAAIATSLAGVTAVLGAYSVLNREIAVNYLGTRPAAATLELPGVVDATLAAAVRRLPGIADSEAREVALARAHVGDEWLRMLLFVVDDFADVRLNRFRPERGAWPPADGTMLVERSAVAVLAADVGQGVTVKTPHGEPREVTVSGIVHDPGLAPAWQEVSGSGYVSRKTFAALGEQPVLHELRVSFSGDPLGVREVEARAQDLARSLAARGYPVTEIRVPPPLQHPHQKQMRTTLFMMVVFAVMALVLSAVLVATSLAALLARQVREIGIMKAIGATRGQIARLYVVLVGLIGAAAVLVAAPVGIAGAGVLARAVSHLLNFDLSSEHVPAWVFAVEVVAGVAIPLLFSAIPIRSASRRSVRQAMDDHGVSMDRTRPAFAALPPPFRNALRRPARLAFTVGLLAAAGAMAMTAIQVKRGWEANVAKVYETRSYDLEVILNEPAPADVASRLAALPGVRAAEAWGYAKGAFTRSGEVDVVRTYPDRGHGSLIAVGAPPGTPLVRFPLRAGRWLGPEDRSTHALVLNHSALAQRPGLRIGDEVHLSIGGRPTVWRLVGVVEEIGGAAAAYVSDEAFAHASSIDERARMFRIATTARTSAERATALRAIEGKLAEAGASVESVMPLALFRTAVGDHILVLVRMLLATAAILAIVGALGLASAMGVSVVERTREIAVMKALGATPRRISRMLAAEAFAIAATSFAVAFAASVPLTSFVDGLVGNLGFLAPLPLVLSPLAAISWLALSLAVALGATLLPARRAAGLVVREALGAT